jgi:signal transduction histidine kinase
LGAAVALAAGGAVVITLSGDMPSEVSLAARQALIVGTPVAVGLYAWREGTHARFGRLLVMAGLAWLVVSLSASSVEVLHSVGRVMGWVVEVGLVSLMLAFPTGRLRSRVDRAMVASAAAVVGFLYLPTVLLADAFPSPSAYESCVSGCPGNAFTLVDSEPPLLDSVVVPLRELLTLLLVLAVLARLAYRVRHATRLMRLTLAPVFTVAALRTLALGLWILLRRAGAADSLVSAGATAVAWGLPAMSLGFLAGLLRWRLYTADSLLRLSHRLRRPSGPRERRALIAETLSDPTVELAYWDPEAGVWRDGDGALTELPPPSADRSATAISDDHGPVAAVIHDAALQEQSPFVESAGAYALVWDDNRRLAAQVEESLLELRASRARILVAGDEERRRIERDLHDGGQQRLVALRINLELADEMMEQDPARARDMVHRLGEDIDAVIEELRGLAAGVYPSMLEGLGLSAALRSAARLSPVPARLTVDGSDRYPEKLETAAYFCCLEALQNVAKHAARATTVRISLHRDGELRFEVRDDGPGFTAEPERRGRGLVNMHDRIEAVGGRLEVRSTPGTGTVVVGRIPAPAG